MTANNRIAPVRSADTDDTPAGLFAALMEPAFHGVAGPVTRIDTHAAAVFLAGDRAVKVKKAVRFPYLDFSTLALRHAACLAEIEANRPFAAQLDYRALPIVAGGPCGFRPGTAADAPEAVEWAVAMRRFDETQTFDRLAAAGGLALAEVERLAGDVGLAHRAMAGVADGEAFVDRLKRTLAEDDDALRAAPELFAAADVEALKAETTEHLMRVEDLLRARARAGLVRRCHGDLHLGNIARLDGVPVAFDALEFDPGLATIDVLYDIAFLIMDLFSHGLEAAAARALDAWLLAAGDDRHLDGLSALPLLMAVRAAIRARVTATRLEGTTGAERTRLEAAARQYLTLALAVLAPAEPVLIGIGGLSGTGKTVLARGLQPRLLPAPGAVLLRSDVERKALAGVAPTDRLPPEAYAPDVTAGVYRRLIDKAHRVISAGHACIVDAVHARADERAALEAVARACEVPFAGLWLEAGLETRVSRVATRQGDASDAGPQVARAQEAFAPAAVGWTVISADGPAEATLAAARAALHQNGSTRSLAR
jgi:hypothetical protein